MFKTLFTKASEISTVAKTFATDYIAVPENSKEKQTYSEEDFLEYRKKIEGDFKNALARKIAYEKKNCEKKIEEERVVIKEKEEEITKLMNIKDEELVVTRQLLQEERQRKDSQLAEIRDKLLFSNFEDQKVKLIDYLKTNLQNIEEVKADSLFDLINKFEPNPIFSEAVSKIDEIITNNNEFKAIYDETKVNEIKLTTELKAFQNEKDTVKERNKVLSIEIVDLLSQQEALKAIESDLTNKLSEIKKQFEAAIETIDKKDQAIEALILENELEAKKETEKKSNIYKMALKSCYMMVLDGSKCAEEIQNLFEVDDDKFFESSHELALKIRPSIELSVLNELSAHPDFEGNLAISNVKEFKAIDWEEIGKELAKPLKLKIDQISKKVNDSAGASKMAKETIEEMKKKHKEQVELYKKEATKLKEQLKEIEETYKDNAADGNLKVELISTLSKEIDLLKKEKEEFNVISMQYNELKSEFSSKVDKIKEREAVCVSENKELKEKNKKLKAEFMKKAEDQAKLEKEIVELTSRFEISKKESYGELERKLKDLQEYSTSLENTIEAANLQKEELRRQHDERQRYWSTTIAAEREAKEALAEKIECLSQIERYSAELRAKIELLDLENGKLRQNKSEMKKYVEETVMKIKEEFSTLENLVDRRIVADLLMKYLSGDLAGPVRKAILETIVNVLELSDEQRQRLGVSSKVNVQKAQGSVEDKINSISDELYKFIVNQ